MHKPQMYLAIDVGATKTLVAIFSTAGKIVAKQKIKTSRHYQQFLEDIRAVLDQTDFKEQRITACCCGVPGIVDRRRGVVMSFGNIAWQKVPLAADLGKLLRNVPVYIENDANLAAVFEAQNHKKYQKILYLTLSTGIGSGSTTNGKLDPAFLDAEVGHMVLEHEGKLKKWEDFASGRALVERFGQTAEQLDNPFAWKSYARSVAKGLDALLAVLQPEAVVIGGSVGAHLEKFKVYLLDELKKYTSDMVPLPPIMKADRAEEAVIYGCYEYLHQSFEK